APASGPASGSSTPPLSTGRAGQVQLPATGAPAGTFNGVLISPATEPGGGTIHSSSDPAWSWGRVERLKVPASPEYAGPTLPVPPPITIPWMKTLAPGTGAPS